MMNKNAILALGIITALLVSACVGTTSNQQDAMEKSGESMENKEAGEVMVKNETALEKTENAMAKDFSGKVLAGNAAKVYDFTKEDYDKALASDNLVVLYFYANWCPICRLEEPKLRAAFDALETNKVIGFRVNYNDNDTDNFEKDIAKQYGITYQHTKVFVKNKQVVLKSLEEWDKDKYLSEINKNI